MLDDPIIGSAFRASLDRIGADLRSQGLMQHLAEIQNQAIGVLRSEFSLLQPIDLSELGTRIEAGGTTSTGGVTVPSVAPEEYLGLINAYLTPSQNNGAVLEIVNIVPTEVSITNVRLISAQDNASETATSLGLGYPVMVPATLPGEPPSIIKIDLPERPDWFAGRLEVTASMVGTGKTHTAVGVRSSPLSAVELPGLDSSIEHQLSVHPFLTADREKGVVSIRPGEWRVGESLVVPAGYRLEVQPGTVLRFAEEAALIAYGEIAFTGTPGNPIQLMPDRTASQTDATWPGVAVFKAPRQSRWSHVMVEQTRGVDWVGWTLTGGVTFFESDVSIDNSVFSDSRGEDALNIINSAFELNAVDFRNTASDAFDSDFSNGRVTGGLYSNIGLNGSGGDAIDVSGTEIVIEGTDFDGVSDKAISVGEKSQARVSGISVVRATTGVVSKDGSDVSVERSKIDGSSLAGLMAYTKKAEYGPARLVANGVEVRDSDAPALAQNGSVVEWNGKSVRTANIDVDALYENTQKP